jgi:hypothetical protein
MNIHCLDLLRNHNWNMQGLIARDFDKADGEASFIVRIEPISDDGAEIVGPNVRHFHKKAEAYDHARTVLGMR